MRPVPEEDQRGRDAPDVECCQRPQPDGLDVCAKPSGQCVHDDRRREEEHIQKLTDAYIKKVDEALAAKEKEILEV